MFLGVPTSSEKSTPAQDLGLPTLVGVAELARAIGRHPKTIRRWGRLGMPYHQPAGRGGDWLINMDEFRTWLRNRCFTHERGDG
jgi:phage terminase Nu1 subunit (DNA packaging protein)